jgi:SAM-dependent methyltransferase
MTKIGDDNIDWDNHWKNIQKDISDAQPRELEWFFNYLPKGQFDVLEIGCGPARYCNAWELIGGHYFGLDFSEEAIAIARKLHPNNQFIHGFNHEVRTFGRTFDVVFTNTHLQHVANINKNFLLQEIHKVLNLEGILITNLEKDDQDTNTTMTYQKWKDFVESHGFKLEKYAGTNQGYVFRRV